MAEDKGKRGRGSGPNAVRGYELAQQGRLDALELADAEDQSALDELKAFALDMAERVDELESNAGMGTPSDGGGETTTGS